LYKYLDERPAILLQFLYCLPFFKYSRNNCSFGVQQQPLTGSFGNLRLLQQEEKHIVEIMPSSLAEKHKQ
jgi:hypothetical protein